MAEKGGNRISVRALVEFILASGDVDSRFRGVDREVEAIRAHQKIQKSYVGPGTYAAEVTLSYPVQRGDLALTIFGRADGIITAADGVTVDEIKTIGGPLDAITDESYPIFWAQAKVYAFIYAEQNHFDSIRVQLTYYRLETDETRIIAKPFTISELTEFFNDIVGRYLHWAGRVREWQVRRDESIKAMEFPFPGYRKGQRDLAVAAYRAMRDGRKLFAQAPTGIGKTMATLFPAVKAMGEGVIEKIFYLTAKTVTRELAEGAIARMRTAGLRLKSVTLTAKEKICFQPVCDCNPETCPFAQGHFDRVRAALEDIYQLDVFVRPVIEEYARKHRVCPFEFSLDIATWSDVVITDYNHLFDPVAHLVRFFDGRGGEYAILIDEAHNLVDRAREMFSAELHKKPFLDLSRRTKKAAPKVWQALSEINTEMIRIRKLCEEEGRNFCVQKEPYEELLPRLKKFKRAASEWLETNQPSAFRDDLLALFFEVWEYLLIAELYDRRYTTYLEKAGGDVTVKMFCLDPSALVRKAVEKGRAAVFFSATLTPLEYFSQILGGQEMDETLRVPSPFPRENLCLLVADNIRTTFRAREFTYDQIVEAISAMVQQRVGNYFVYLPSYRYQEEVYQRFCGQNPGIEVIRQTSGMSEEERAAFLGRFSLENQRTLVGFAVMGGVFGEGIDLVGDRLSGCAIVGVGLPQICLERDIIRNYFQDSLELGFEYAYIYPGMNKVLQAAGRVIRTETDRGVVLLIDERFAMPVYQELFPREWHSAVRVRNAGKIVNTVRDFWAERGNPVRFEDS